MMQFVDENRMLTKLTNFLTALSTAYILSLQTQIFYETRLPRVGL
jgi:hypothetical protein